MTGALNWYRGADIGLVEGLGPITTPTLYVWSTEDVALAAEAAEATAECVQDPYQFAVIEGVSHWIAEQAPGARAVRVGDRAYHDAPSVSRRALALTGAVGQVDQVEHARRGARQLHDPARRGRADAVPR